MHTSSYIDVLTSRTYNSELTLETPLQGLRECAYTSIEMLETTVENSLTSIEQGWVVGTMEDYGKL